LRHGATRNEILEVLQIASVLGIHAYMVGVPVLIDELAAAGTPLDTVLPLDEAFERVKSRFTEQRGYWSDQLQSMVRSSPAFFRHGATPAQILQVMQIVSCLGMQSFLIGAPQIQRHAVRLHQ
jgi:hypothetical protein